MSVYFTAEDVVQDSFLFVSYSHENKELTDYMAEQLLDKGVRLWYDKDLARGDPWPRVVETLLAHENCRGVIFVCSPDAYLSKNVHKERKLALDIQNQRGASKYPFFLVNVCDSVDKGSYMKLLKNAFDRIDIDSIDSLFSIELLNTLVSIIGPDPLCVMTASENWCAQLTEEGIRRRAPETIDRGSVILEKMQKAAHFGNISITMGQFECSNGVRSLKWQLVSRNENNGVFLLETPLPEMYGGDGLAAWLDGEFRKTAFTPSLSDMIIGQVRLLTIDEARNIPESVTKIGNRWWLADRQRNKQAWVDTDGNVDEFNYSIVSRFAFDVRPAITLTMEDAQALLK